MDPICPDCGNKITLLNKKDKQGYYLGKCEKCQIKVRVETKTTCESL
jgi:tRNA(Ile2) C34 agmatinyltransferase TiaS